MNIRNIKRKDPACLALFPVLGLVCLMSSCSPARQAEGKSSAARPLSTDTLNLDFTAEEAPEWTALFDRDSGWFGADGIFALPLNGVDSAGGSDSTLLIFSDTMVGEIKEGELQPGWAMVNNTVAYLKGSEPAEEQISFHWKKNAGGKPATFFVPETPSAEKGDYYWLGDGFVNAEKKATYIFAYRMRNLSDDAWSFAE
ncbi:MAG TPA: hypothetical protein VD772_12270, partial [Anseongella sp.]|nr:hypothetical protein [Anseongella sp.]